MRCAETLPTSQRPSGSALGHAPRLIGTPRRWHNGLCATRLSRRPQRRVEALTPSHTLAIPTPRAHGQAAHGVETRLVWLAAPPGNFRFVHTILQDVLKPPRPQGEIKLGTSMVARFTRELRGPRRDQRQANAPKPTRATGDLKSHAEATQNRGRRVLDSRNRKGINKNADVASTHASGRMRAHDGYTHVERSDSALQAGSSPTSLTGMARPPSGHPFVAAMSVPPNVPLAA